MDILQRSIPWVAKTVAIVAAACLLATPLQSSAQVTIGFTIGSAPPALPYYSQPAMETAGQVWQPGYWAYGPNGYYWVPGTWVTPPSANLYWTPGYWGYDNGQYAWNNGYWGQQVGYYGGINYGYGYYGTGYNGGMWRNNVFFYNTAAMAVTPGFVRNYYVNRNGVVRVVGTRYAFNGPGGILVRPTAREIVVMRERHIAPTSVQVVHARIAAQDRNLLFTVNRGRPATVVVARPVTTVRELPHYEAVRPSDRRTTTTTTTRERTTTTTTGIKAHASTPQSAPKHTTTTHTTTTHTTTHSTTHSKPPSTEHKKPPTS